MVRQEIELPWSCDQCREHPAAVLDHTAAYEPAADEPTEPAADEPADYAANGIQDNSFNVHEDIRERPHIQNGELPDPPPNRNVIPDGPVTYEVVEGATRKGGQMLLGSDGYTYVVKRSNPVTCFVYWVCNVRSKAKHCSAWVNSMAKIV
ncbi:uncharacterized protein LOC127864668 [Dreissena polymorpha]|nr:uncharacterized protein LOC127864668 [Dreissena polymorpha]